jgi:L-asparaginase/Glu-tRNA(Gln) amidotransferase subunit D
MSHEKTAAITSSNASSLLIFNNHCREKKASILIIYTGGTIGMVHDLETGSLIPFDFSHISDQVPELKRFGFNLQTITFDP